MEREHEHIDQQLIELGAVSTETRGNGGPSVDIFGPAPLTGISDDD